MDGHSPESLTQTTGAASDPVNHPVLRRYAFICNERAGSGTRHDQLEQLLEQLSAKGHDAHRFPCNISPEATAWAAIRKGYDVIVAVGGDGTVSGCAAAVWKHASGLILGVIPTGTLNHFAKDIGIPDVPTALKTIEDGGIRPVDIGTVNGVPFVNNSGIGLYPAIVRKREFTRRAGAPRWVAFVLATLAVLSRLPVRRLYLEIGENRIVHRTPFLFVGNNAYRVEGLGLGTRELLDGSVLGIYASGSRSRVALIRMAFRALVGKLREERDFFATEAAQLTVRSRHSTLQVSLDGELRRLHAPLEYQSVPGVLPVLAPRDTPRREPRDEK